MKKNEYMEELKRMAQGEDANDEVINDETSAGDSKEESETENAEENMPVIDTADSKEYSITIQVKDMQHFVLRHMYSSFAGWFGVLISVVAFVMVGIGWNSYGNFEKIALIILGLLFTVVQPVQLMLKAKRQVISQEMFKTPLIYNICKDGIVVSQGETKVSVVWNDIYKVKQTSKAVFIYTSPVRAFIFPKNQLGDVNEFMSFIK